MRKITLEVLAALALTIAAIITSATGVKANDLMVMAPFARASETPMAKTGAAYMMIMNHGGVADRLVSVSSDVAATAEVHRMTMDGDVMRMEPAGIIEIPANSTVELMPGSLHVMFTGLKAPLKQGETITLVLNFEKSGAMQVAVPVGGAAATSHDHAAGASGG